MSFLQEETLHEAQTKIKEVEEERSRLQKTNAAQLTQLDKYKKLAEDTKSRADSVDTQIAGMKKVIMIFIVSTFRRTVPWKSESAWAYKWL